YLRPRPSAQYRSAPHYAHPSYQASMLTPYPSTDSSPPPLHDALPIWQHPSAMARLHALRGATTVDRNEAEAIVGATEWLMREIGLEEHTSELQSLAYLVWRLLLVKKKKLEGVL